MNKFSFLGLLSFLGMMSCSQPTALDPQNKEHLVAQTTNIQQDSYILPSYDWSVPWNPVCEAGDFCWKNPQPFVTNINLNAMLQSSLAFPDGTLWLVGNDGLILKKQGNTWKQIPSPLHEILNIIVGKSPDDVWITFSIYSNQNQAVLHCKQETCTQVPFDKPSHSLSHFVQIDTDDIWFYGDGLDASVYHYSKTDDKFINMDSLIQAQLSPAQKTYQVIGVWGKSKTEVTLFLSLPDPMSSDQTESDGGVLALPWDGTKFGAVKEALPKNSLFSVILYGDSTKELWLKGYDSLQGFGTFAMYHFDGTNFEKVTGAFLEQWRQIIGISTYPLIGFYQDTFWGFTAREGALYRLKGTTWEKVLDPLPLYPGKRFWIDQNQLFFLNVFSLEMNNLALYQVQLGNPASLSPVWKINQTNDFFQNIWTFSKDERWFLMEDATLKFHLVHQQGQQNQSYDLPQSKLGSLRAGFPIKSGEFWFGGSNAIYRVQDNVLSTYTFEDQSNIQFSFVIASIWGSGSNDVWAVSDEGHIFHFDGTIWSLVAKSQGSYSPYPLRVVFGTSPSNVFIGGEGILLHFDGTKFSVIPLPTADFKVRWIWGTQENDVWFSDSKTIVHDTGTQQETFVPPLSLISSVFQSHSGEVWLVGEGLKVFQGNGKTWQEVVDLSKNAPLADWQIAGYDQNDLWLFSPSQGYVLRKQK